ncbi:MAG: hypothetical protein HUJ65_04400, partial [Oscillospiraceae bacterium]|nr:hypothetical protein [Oscillospiraceae bacterium]
METRSAGVSVGAAAGAAGAGVAAGAGDAAARADEQSRARAGAPGTHPEFDRLVRTVWRLRQPDGCPWDREQTLETLKPCLVEECYELLDVMAGDDKAGHAEELGDVLLQVMFQCHVREEKGDFSL